jgi:hypothetical protein
MDKRALLAIPAVFARAFARPPAAPLAS